MSILRTTALLLVSLLSFSIISCNNSSDAIPEETEVEQVISPIQSAGTIEKNNNKFIATSGAGYVFDFWVIISDRDTTYTQTKELEISNDTTRKAVAHFNKIQMLNANTTSFTSSHDGQFIYFINRGETPISNSLPPDTKYVYKIFRYNVETEEKEAIYRSDARLIKLDISHNDQFLSFSKDHFEDSEPDNIYVLDLNQRTAQKIAPGVQSDWANNSLRLVSGNEKGLYTYNAQTYSTRYIADVTISDRYGIAPTFTQARWSPDDENILLSIVGGNTGKFSRYNFSEQRIIKKSIEGLDIGTFYGWITPSNFIIVGNTNDNKVFRYSLLSPEPSRQLPIRTYWTIGISPDKKFVAYSPVPSVSGLQVYNVETGSIQTIGEDLGFSGNNVLWNNNKFILTYDNDLGIIMVYPEGKIKQI